MLNEGHDDERTIGPTPERLAKARGEFEQLTPDKSVNSRAFRMLDGHVLESELSAGRIGTDQYAAGMLYYRHWYDGGQCDSGVIDPGRVIVDGGLVDHMTDKRLDALTNYNAALKHLTREHKDIMHYVVLYEMPLEQYGRIAWESSSEKLSKVMARARLGDALLELDRFYYGRKMRGIRKVYAPDYRPRIVGNWEREQE